MPKDGKAGNRRPSSANTGTVPVGGVIIVLIYISCRKRGTRITIMIDEVVIVIDIW